jgi:hypothetical protein
VATASGGRPGAFAAQLVVDFVAFCAREALLSGASMREQLAESA